MNRFKTILVIPAQLSGEDAAVRRAMRLAVANDARVTLAWPMDDVDVPDVPPEIRAELLIEAADGLHEAAVPLRSQGIDVETRVMEGRPFIRIIERVREAGHDLVIKTARGRQLYRSLFFGTTALHLMRKCPCPVWIVDPERGALAGGVMAAIDPDVEDETGRAVATTLLQLATSLAVQDRVPLHVLHVWDAPYENTLRQSPRFRMTPADADAYVAGIEARHRQRLDDVVAPFHHLAPAMTVDLVRGLAAEVVPREARDRHIDTIVMATLGRGGVPGLLIGNTAEAVLGQVACAVLTIKPPGFVSPVGA